MERATEREQFLRKYEEVLMASNRPASQQVQEIVVSMLEKGRYVPRDPILRPLVAFIRAQLAENCPINWLMQDISPLVAQRGANELLACLKRWERVHVDLGEFHLEPHQIETIVDNGVQAMLVSYSDQIDLEKLMSISITVTNIKPNNRGGIFCSVEIVFEGKGGEVLLKKTAILEDQARDGNTVVRPVTNVIVLPRR